MIISALVRWCMLSTVIAYAHNVVDSINTMHAAMVFITQQHTKVRWSNASKNQKPVSKTSTPDVTYA